MAAEEWAGRVAVVTGGAGAMGQAVVRALMEKGVKVAVFDMKDPLDQVELGSSDDWLAVPLDLAERAQIVDGYRAVDESFGRVDMLVNLAALNSTRVGLADVEPDEWQRVMSVNLAGTFWMCQEAVRRMQRQGGGGSIVNISSINGFRARFQFPTHVYAIAKAGVIGLTMTLASEVGQYGIRVNCVAPGIHMSPMALEAAGPGDAGRRYFQEAADATPLRRVADASEMAGPIMFLLSEAAGYMTGQVLPSDGGRALVYH